MTLGPGWRANPTSPSSLKKRQCFRGFHGKNFHYIFFWIIFAGSLRRSFSSRICWWSVGFETQRVRISTPLRVGSTTSIERMSDSSKSTLRGSLPSPALSVSSAGSIDLRAESTACWTPSRPASSSYPATQRLVALAPWPCDTTQPAPNRRASVRFSFCSIGG